METQKRRRKPKANYKPSPAKDNCQTPPYAVIPLQPWLRNGWRIWEPAAGEGYLAERLRRVPNMAMVLETDILTGYDFLEANPLDMIQMIDAIVTNPPGSTKYQWFKQCCWLWHSYRIPFALLMPTDTAFAAKGAYLVETYGIEIIAPTKRINYKMPFKGWGGQSQFHSSWFTCGLGIGRRLTYFDMSNVDMTPPQEPPPDQKQLTLFDPTFYEIGPAHVVELTP